MSSQLEPEYEWAYRQWKTSPTPGSRATLLDTVNPVLDTALKSYGGASQTSPTLRSKARLAALKAFDSYDPSRATLRTHLISQLRGLQRSAIKEQNIISLPEQVMLHRQQLAESETELRDRLGREPNTMELADHTGLSPKRIGYIRQFRGSLNTGSVMDQANDDNESTAPASTIPGYDPGFDAWAEFVYHDLGERDRYILEHTVGMHGRPRLGATEIGKKLGISAGAVSQRAARIQGMLDERSKINLF